ncbi:hypothetical protein CAEBREN_20722 [Caenorhabditis brenneri]|uniref:Uncharacterized protein n=1 Tax=Caenorhabditis brenneri TaxID=135651 RepID=G0N336_CAEBE|nr:hypothetical protein CAEBREN_20722 [Caenorhabditis brenneri]
MTLSIVSYAPLRQKKLKKTEKFIFLFIFSCGVEKVVLFTAVNFYFASRLNFCEKITAAKIMDAVIIPLVFQVTLLVYYQKSISCKKLWGRSRKSTATVAPVRDGSS